MSAHGTITPPSRAGKVVEFPAPRADRRILVPREHGSWALWVLPLLSGGLVGFASVRHAPVAPALWFSVVAACCFLIQQPLQVLLGTSLLKVRSAQEQRIAVSWVMALTALAAFAAFELLLLRRGFVFVFGLAAALCFGAGALMGHGRALRIPRQLAGAAGLSLSGAGAYYVITGNVDCVAFLLWLGSWLFAASQIEYVQLRLRSANLKSRAGKLKSGRGVILLHLLLLLSGIALMEAGLPVIVGALFLPASFRLLFWLLRSPSPLKLYVLGFTELFQSIVFNALLAMAFLSR